MRSTTPTSERPQPLGERGIPGFSQALQTSAKLIFGHLRESNAKISQRINGH